MDTRFRLTVVTSISGLGDMGYNDKIMSGIMEFYGHHDVNMTLVSPTSLDEVRQLILDWRKIRKAVPGACFSLRIMLTNQF